ncbi:MAG: CDP-alcohol phosphatidyltransferase family protein [Clostridiales bacterium]|nr:CDP-alcohol phosphatidyltransferase family protein [Clostridiales bacterium]MCD7828411.1 CDP-alcohol phosphatidyltransferase family protein [Clostridiales bacterium]
MKEKLAFLFENWKTIPNFMSFIRILLIPVFAVLFYNDHTIAAVIVLAISGLSDLFDGKIARRFNQVSNLGKILDPVADKLTVFAIAIILFIKFVTADDRTLRLFSWVFLLFIAKDLFMLSFGGFMIAKGMRPAAAEIYGKIATVAFYCVMIVIMAVGPEVGAFRSYFTLPNAVMMVMVVIAVILTFVAFASYIPDVYRQCAERFGWGKNKKNKKK